MCRNYVKWTVLGLQSHFTKKIRKCQNYNDYQEINVHSTASMYHGIVFIDTVAYRFFPKDHTSFIMQDGCCSLNQQLFSLLFTPYYTDERTRSLFAAHYSNPSLKTEFSVASWAFLLSSSLWYLSTLEWMHLFIQDPCENEILLALFYRFTDKILFFQSEAPTARFFQCAQFYLLKQSSGALELSCSWNTQHFRKSGSRVWSQIPRMQNTENFFLLWGALLFAVPDFLSNPFLPPSLTASLSPLRHNEGSQGQAQPWDDCTMQKAEFRRWAAKRSLKEGFRNFVWMCRHGVRKSSAQLELIFVRDIKENNRNFCAA